MTTPTPQITTRFRTIDGSDNAGRDTGKVGRPLLSLGASGATFDPNRQPSPRAISNAVAAQRDRLARLDEYDRSEFVWAWGQFLDHELDLVEPDHGEPAAIPVPLDDPTVEFRGTSIAFSRSKRTSGEIRNRQTAYVDASNVYGVDDRRASALRGGRGRLRTSGGPDGDLPPKNDGAEPFQNAGDGDPERFFLAGDVRANEHPVLTSLHALFVREHNRLCDVIDARQPGLDDEELYQRARKVVGAQMQAITYYEFLPALLGPDAMPAYNGFKPAVDPGISNLFAAACYRLGHSMVREDVALNVADRRLPLEHVFFTPELVDRLGIEPFLSRLAHRRMAHVDTTLVDGLREFLFRRDTIAMLDLASLNIQRGRDHELPDYNGCRAVFGLPPVSDFTSLTDDAALAARLDGVYGGRIDELDPWVGALAESPRPGRYVGDLLLAALVDQFTRLRDGDFYWFENDPELSAFDRIAIGNTRLADVVRRNTGLDVPDDVFHVAG